MSDEPRRRGPPQATWPPAPELRAWQTTRRRMLAEIEHLRADVHSPHVTRAARLLERELEALDRKLTR